MSWRAAIFASLMLLAACDAPRYNLVSYKNLAGWQSDDHAAALTAFRQSCAAKMPAAFARACVQAAQATNPRHFFEAQFDAYHVSNPSGADGFVTGYYEPVLRGSHVRSEQYSVPLYAPPRRITPDDPYLTRRAIESQGVLTGSEVIWLEDTVQAFFLHIQGSGKILLPDGRLITAQFAGKNYQPYTPIGRLLKERGEIALGEVSLQTIQAWLYANPDKAQALMWENEAYVFFRIVENAETAKGAQGVRLSAERSIAVDPRFNPYGTPIYLTTELADGAPFTQLLIAQDTGGAIKGAMRGDIFFGRGAPAEQRAGGLQAPARWVMLWPKGSHPDERDQRQ